MPLSRAIKGRKEHQVGRSSPARLRGSPEIRLLQFCPEFGGMRPAPRGPVNEMCGALLFGQAPLGVYMSRNLDSAFARRSWLVTQHRTRRQRIISRNVELVLFALLGRRSLARASRAVPDVERVGHLGSHIYAARPGTMISSRKRKATSASVLAGLDRQTRDRKLYIRGEKSTYQSPWNQSPQLSHIRRVLSAEPGRQDKRRFQSCMEEGMRGSLGRLDRTHQDWTAAGRSST